MPKRILIIGGPSTGKTTLIDYLKEQNYHCLDEVSREVIKKAQDAGIDQLFLEEPLRFSEMLLEARIEQFDSVADSTEAFVFIDRGIPDTVAYMDYVKQEYTSNFIDACENYRYDTVFVLPPWEAIHITDGERYENFEQAQAIQKALLKTYETYGYQVIPVPMDTVARRATFILDQLND